MNTLSNRDSHNFDDSFEQYAESTNPFGNSSFSSEKNTSSGSAASSKGKRPRIYKPLYSVRLS